MRLIYPDLQPGDAPIDSVAAYQAARARFNEPRARLLAWRGPWTDEREQLKREEFDLYSQFRRSQPSVRVARCPFCGVEIWQKAGWLFGLQDEFWYMSYSDGREGVPESSRCPHLFCVDGSLALNGYPPTDATGSKNSNPRITMAAEVPFVKPRVLALPTMVAVLHALPVAERYRAFPLTYFAEQQPPQEEFCIPWARKEYVDRYRDGVGGTFIGQRSDAQDYDLDRWAAQGKLLWLDPNDPNEPLVRGAAVPYTGITGRRHPYVIESGQIQELPAPRQGEATVKRELFR